MAQLFSPPSQWLPKTGRSWYSFLKAFIPGRKRRKRKERYPAAHVSSEHKKSFKLADMEEPHVTYKILLLGDSSVGKTSLMNSVAGRPFQETLVSTVGIDFIFKNIRLPNGVWVRLQIWDTCGQERFRTITESYYRNTHGLLFVYDLTRRKTFEGLKYWLESVDKHVTAGGADVTSLIVGNKLDLPKQRVISVEEAEQLTNNYASGYGSFETSSRTDEGIEKVFFELAKWCLECHNPEMVGGSRSRCVSIYLDEAAPEGIRKVSSVEALVAQDEGPIGRPREKRKSSNSPLTACFPGRKKVKPKRYKSNS